MLKALYKEHAMYDQNTIKENMYNTIEKFMEGMLRLERREKNSKELFLYTY